MPNRSRAIDNVAKMIEREVKAQLRSSSTKWNDFTILPVPEWRKILFSNPSDAVKFLPENYIQDGSILSIFLDKQAFDSWSKSWLDFLSSRKDPSLGRLNCQGCILDCEPGPIGRHVLEKLGIGEKCQTVNAFLCPYKKDFKDLVFVGNAAKLVERILTCSAKQAFYDLQKTFKVDFGHNVVRCFRYPADAHVFEDTIQNQLVPISNRITLDGPDDYSEALSNEELFGMAFDQYCDFVENGSRYYGIKIPSKNDADKIRQTKNEILFFVKGLDVDHIVLDELHQNLLDFLRKEKDNFAEHKRRAISADPILFRDIIENDRNGTCSVCGKFGNIKCVGCSTWMCKEHWRSHELYNCKLL